MSGTTEIGNALRTRLTAVSPGAAVSASLVAWENKSFDPPTSGFWYRVTLLPGVPRAAAIGEAAQNRHVGVFVVSIFGQPDQGDGLVAEEAERIAACYKRGTVLTANGVQVVCVRAYRKEGQEEPDCFGVPVFVEWRADVAN